MTLLEFIGYLASALVVVSISFKTSTFTGTLLMRILNGIGSFIFIVYGVLIKADPTALTNCIAFIINLVYLIIEIRDHRKVEVKHEDLQDTGN